MESVAESHLQESGLRTLDRNFSARGGEIDLIMQDGATLVFVEVRFRKRHGKVSALESVTVSKQKRVINAAKTYLQKNSKLDRMACRFDVVAIESNELQKHPNIQWIKSAFDAYS